MAKKTVKTKKPVKKAAKPAPKKAAKPAKAAAKKAAAPKKAAKPAPAAKKGAAPKKAAPAKAAAKPEGAKALGKKLLGAVAAAGAAAVAGAVAKKAGKGAPVPKGKAGAPAKGKGKVEEVEETAELEAAAAEEELTDEEIVLTDAEGRRYCRVKDCDQLSAVDGYCRYHYLALWKRIQVRKKILSEGKLERYIEDLTARYPDKFLDMLKKDLRSEKEFLAAIQELEIDESAVDNEFEDEAQTYIDEVRGMGEATERSDEDF